MATNTEMMIHGVMTPVTVFDQTAQAIDDAAVKAKSMAGKNLLSNSVWVNPDTIIDQRGGWVIPPGTVVYYEAELTTPASNAISGYRNVEIMGDYARYWWTDGGVYLYAKLSDCVRGYTGYGYTIDRWKLGSTGLLLIEDGYISLDPLDGVARNLEHPSEVMLEAGTYTISALLENAGGANIILGGGDDYKTASCPNDDKQVISRTVSVSERTTFTFYIQTTKRINIYAAKLELGSQQTLAHQENGVWVPNEIPDKNEELLKCCMSTDDPADEYANNKKTPAAINAVNKADPNGDTMAGVLRTGGGYSRFVGNIGYAGFSHQTDPKNDGNRLWFGAYYDGWNGSLLRLVKYENGAVTQDSSILHTGNKPFGSYTGNGSATARTINTGGLGNSVMITSARGMAIVTNGNCITSAGANVNGVAYSETHFAGGDLYLATSNSFLNENGVTYQYQVL